MGKKVNYNKKSNKLRIIGIVVLIVLISFILIKGFINALKSVKQSQESQNMSGISSKSNFNSLEELLEKYDCKLIDKTESQDLLTANIDFSRNLYTGESSNERFFVNLCKEIALFENYKNLKLTDKSKKIEIEVTCEETNIVEFKINGDVNYYLNANSKLNRDKQSSEVRFTIQSEELQNLIDTKWDETKTNFGTQESTFNDYKIYFDEGIKYKTVGRNIFNIVFTNKYESQVAGGLTTNATPGQVRSNLGDPTFEDGDNLYGYIGEKSYLFFDFANHQISCYPKITISEEDEEAIKGFIEEMNNSNDIKEFATNLVNIWGDYDYYGYDLNYVDLRYTLKGFRLDIYENSFQNGIYIYQNYSGDRNITDLENVYMKDTDMIYDNERSRVYYEEEKAYGALQSDYESSGAYYVELINSENYGIIKGRFISIDGTRPDVEINDSIYTFVWMSDTELIYSVQEKGIYYYNFDNFTKQVLIEGKENYNIKSFENNVLSYDDTSILIQK